MSHKSSFGGAARAGTTPRSPTSVEPAPTGGAAKSGQYPGIRQNEGAAEAGQTADHLAPPTSARGTDPALAGDYVHNARSGAQGPTPGKDQVKSPNEPLAPAAGGTLGSAGGEYPGIPVPLNWGELDSVPDPEYNLAGATKGPQPREGAVGVSAKHYPGVPQHIEGLAGADGSDDVRSILENEGDDLNLRGVGGASEGNSVGGRTVESV